MSQKSPELASRTCGVIVTYHPEEGVWALLGALLEQVPRVVVVDNASRATVRDRLREMAEADDRVTVLEQADNMGIATALNEGLAWAAAEGFQWAITMDQDSDLFPHAVGILEDVLSAYPRIDEIGMVGLNYRDNRTGKVLNDQLQEQSYTNVRAVITSGTLVNIKVWGQVGRFRDDYFIDAVDTEYCLRLAQNGYAVLLSREVGLEHSIGDVVIRQFLWLRRPFSQYVPLRRYYIARNHIDVIKTYWRYCPRCVARMAYFVLLATLPFIMIDAVRHPAFIWAWICGVWDGLRGRLGKRQNVSPSWLSSGNDRK